jgi:hypothetical protein
MDEEADPMSKGTKQKEMMRMSSNRSWNRVVVSGFLAVFLLCGIAYADAQVVAIKVQPDTMKTYDPVSANRTVIKADTGFVQCIKGSPGNPPTGVAGVGNDALWAGDIYLSMENFGDLKGKVGDFLTGGDGGFIKQGTINAVADVKYFIRYWDFPEDPLDPVYYANSVAQKTWDGGPGPFPWLDMPFSGFTFYKAAAPYEPVISEINQTESLSKQLYPPTDDSADAASNLSVSWSGGTSSTGDANIQVKGSSSKSAYELLFSRNADFSKVDLTIPRSSASANLDKLNNTKYANYFSDTVNPYYARVIAHNYFGSTTGPSVPFQLAKGGPPSPGGEGVGPFNLTGFFTVDDPDDPYKYALSYFVPYYIMLGDNLVDENENGYLDCDDVLTQLDVALKAADPAGDYDVLEVNFWNELNQQWDVAAQWRDYAGVKTRYWVNSLAVGNYEYPETVDTIAEVPFTQGAYVYLAFGKINAAGNATAGWREAVAPMDLAQPLNWQP